MAQQTCAVTMLLCYVVFFHGSRQLTKPAGDFVQVCSGIWTTQSVQFVLLHFDQMPTDVKKLYAYLCVHGTFENMCYQHITLHVC